MTTAVELSEDGFLGTLRNEGQPDLVAHRPEEWRFLRLSRVMEVAKAIAQTELGLEGHDALIHAMIWISDLKGDFTVGWRASEHRLEFNDIVTRALATEQEADIAFVFDEDP